MLCRLQNSWDQVLILAGWAVKNSAEEFEGDSNKLNIKESLIKLEFYNFVKFYVKFNIIIKSNGSNILNRFNNEKINL